MTVREALRAQRKAMKDRPLKENIAYLWDYYGMKAIVIIIVMIALLSTVISVVSRKDSGFCGAFFVLFPGRRQSHICRILLKQLVSTPDATVFPCRYLRISGSEVP